ncbi:MAG: HAMP domain-containing histidine kinase [Lachnospiraceae bacterium]|nr:HAMP domain-containing histidine kinase [Lachnospiraceae bacterium]
MFRNREIRQFSIVFIIITIICAVAGIAIHPAVLLLVFFSAAAYGAAFFIFTKSRYKRIAQLSDQICTVLHNPGYLYISSQEEGELSILETEITKMVLCIKEQNEALKREKKHLADSLADIAHQLRTPLTSANLVLSLLKNNPGNNTRKALLRETEELYIHMDWLVSSLLKLSRLDAGIVDFKCARSDLGKLINETIRLFQIQMELHGINVYTDIPDGVVIWCDYRWLLEAVQNIIKNCIENIASNGTIEITAEDNLLFTEVKFHDSGSGFDKEDLPHLFDRFYRGKDATTAGYGIGLALCKTIIARQGGTITAKNHPDGGAVFIMRFPKHMDKVTNLSL